MHDATPGIINTWATSEEMNIKRKQRNNRKISEKKIDLFFILHIANYKASSSLGHLEISMKYMKQYWKIKIKWIR